MFGKERGTFHSAAALDLLCERARYVVDKAQRSLPQACQYCGRIGVGRCEGCGAPKESENSGKSELAKVKV